MVVSVGSRLPLSYYVQDDVVFIARDLLGKVIHTQINGECVSAYIIETEAYAGETDRACHAFGGCRTERTEMMYAAGGVAYVYLCYGMHHLLNIVTNCAGVPDAVLIRAIQPLSGVSVMERRRHRDSSTKDFLVGPGKVTQALGVGRAHNGVSLLGDELWLESGLEVLSDDVLVTPRIGIDYAGEDASRLYRFVWRRGKG